LPQNCLLHNENISEWALEEINTRLLSVQYSNDTNMKVLIKISGRTLDILVLTGGQVAQSSPPNTIKAC
jgi:activator of HSP90 ATPase